MDRWKRILLFPEGEEEGGGGGDGDGDAGAGEGEGDKTSGAVDTKDKPAAPKFDASAAVPAGVLPSELSMYEGKSYEDVFKGVGEMRKSLTEATTKNTELAEQLKKAAASPEGAEAARQASMVTTEEYQQILANFYDTGEVPDAFVKAVADQGAKIAPDEMLEFFQWKKGRRETQLAAGAEASPEGVDFNDLLGWMSAGNSGFSKEERAGFQAMSERGNYSWVEMVAGDYTKAIENNSHRPNLAGNRFMGGEARKGKPALGGDKAGFSDSAAFAKALRDIENDRSLNAEAKHVRRKAVIVSRAKQRGEKIPGVM